ncbi:TetR/AcrR family transcriptional regulator [Streptomyces griseoloalbus]|uniref:AcrR family transcriptional regulator n=1 Tax=Streptomyces griseoloalbus TaxID=67303 RepID=A0A7W8FAA4_9ACTN|nr:TetR family transcriptional regulator [Streptomyces albaduncus]MBB5127982.1 AcrR family transcriptional regulator [Streptomyces albaduncus]GGW57631.1 TetR family transcriptional regulator [Streptomyces albaduncus]
MAEPRLRRDAERNRQLLLETAHALMARDGLEVTYQEIAAAAGTGTGTVYRRFPDRQQLVDTVFAEHIDAVVELARQACRFDDPWAGLTWFMERQLELEADNRGLGQLLRGGHQSSELVIRGRAQITPLAADLLERAVRTGLLPAGVTPADLVTVHLMVGAVMDTARQIDPDLWRRALAVALAGLQHAALPTRQPDDDLIDRLFGVPATPRERKAAPNEPAE